MWNVYLRSPGGTRTRRGPLLVSLPIPRGSSLDIFFPLLAVRAAVRRRAAAVQTRLLLMLERRVVRLLRAIRLLHVRVMPASGMPRAHHAVHQVAALLRALGGGRITATPHDHASTPRHPLFHKNNFFFIFLFSLAFLEANSIVEIFLIIVI